MSRRLWTIVAIIAVVFIGVAWVNSNNKTTEAGAGNGKRITHSIGKQDATVTLVEYSDFQCPACEAYYPVVEQVVQKYKDRISFEYRHYPLTSLHANAFAAARASEAAGKQDKFWEMYRLLFVNQSAWEGSGSAAAVFEGYAKQLGLNLVQFRADYASREVNSAISASIAEFNRRGLPQATPTFLLNNKKIEPRSLGDFSKLIDKALGA